MIKQTIVSYILHPDNGSKSSKVPVESNVLKYFDIRTPENAYTGLYGVKSTRLVIGHLMREFRGEAQRVYPVDLTFSSSINACSYICEGGRDNEDDNAVALKDTTTLNMLRLRKGLRDQMYQRWYHCMRSEGVPYPDNDEFIKKGTEHPWLLDRLIKDPMFSHIKMVIYPVTTPVGIIMVCTSWKKNPKLEWHGDFDGKVIRSI